MSNIEPRTETADGRTMFFNNRRVVGFPATGVGINYVPSQPNATVTAAFGGGGGKVTSKANKFTVTVNVLSVSPSNDLFEEAVAAGASWPAAITNGNVKLVGSLSVTQRAAGEDSDTTTTRSWTLEGFLNGSMGTTGTPDA